MNFSHLNEQKFRHDFNDTISAMFPCGKEPETTIHYLLRCTFYTIYRLELPNDICALNHFLKNISEENLLKVLLYGLEEFSFKINSEILKCTIKFIKKTDRFSCSLFFSWIFSPNDQVNNGHKADFTLQFTKTHRFPLIYVQFMYRIYIKRYISYVNFVSCVVLFYYFYLQ